MLKCIALKCRHLDLGGYNMKKAREGSPSRFLRSRAGRHEGQDKPAREGGYREGWAAASPH